MWVADSVARGEYNRVSMDHLRRLLEHMAWADRRVGEALAATSPGAEELELYAHVIGTEEVWLARLEERVASSAVWPEIDMESCLALSERVRTGYTALLARLSASDIARPIAYRNSAGADFVSTVEDILLQVALHGSYHRGQIASRLRGRGAEPATSDYIAFLRGSPAATRAPRP